MKNMTNMTAIKSRAHGTRVGFIAVFLTVLTLILSACGANIETSLNLENAQKGARTMTIVFSPKDNKEYVKGDVSTMDTSIKKHLPSELSFGGIQTEGDKARASFTLSFQSVEEYRTKVENLLKLSGSSIQPTIDIFESNQGLVQGAQIHENFESKDLLGWIPEALQVDGLIESNRKNNVLGHEEKTTVTISGHEVKNSSHQISVQDVKDNGFYFVLLSMQLQQDGTFQMKAYFRAKDIMSPQQAKIVDTYLEGAKPDGAKLTKGVDQDALKKYYTGASEANTSSGKEEQGRTVTFTASNLEDLQDKLQKLLGAKDIELKRDQQVKDSSDVLSVQDQITAHVNCLMVCSPEGQSIQVEAQGPDSTYYSEGYVEEKSTSDSRLIRTVKVNQYHNVSVRKTRTAVALGTDGTVEARFEYTVKSADTAQVADALKQKLAPAEGTGEFSESAEGENTVYSAVIKGKDSAEFNTRLGQYLPGSGSAITITHPGGYNPFGAAYTVSPEINLESKTGSMSGESSFEYTAPFMSTIDQAKFESKLLSVKAPQVQGQKFTLTSDRSTLTNTKGLVIPASGLTISDMVIDAVVVLLLLLIVLILLIFRKRVGASARRSREQRAALAAAQQAQRAGYAHPQNSEAALLAQGTSGYHGYGSSAQYAQNTGYEQDPTVQLGTAFTDGAGYDSAQDGATRVLPQTQEQDPGSGQQPTRVLPVDAPTGQPPALGQIPAGNSNLAGGGQNPERGTSTERDFLQ